MNQAIFRRKVRDSRLKEIKPFLLAGPEQGIKSFTEPFELTAGLRANEAQLNLPLFTRLKQLV